MPRVTIVKTEYEAGAIVTTDESGNRRSYPVANILRSEDIPDVEIASLTLLTTMARIFFIVLETLVEKEVLGEELVSGFDLQHVYDTLLETLLAEYE